VGKNCTTAAWRTYRNTEELYYIDDIEQVISVLSNGIAKEHATNSEGKTHTIVCFTKRAMAATVARRLGIAHFALFRVKKNAIPKHRIQWEAPERSNTGALLYCFCDHIDKDAVELIDCFEAE
jgi:hypothetical protein